MSFDEEAIFAAVAEVIKRERAKNMEVIQAAIAQLLDEERADIDKQIANLDGTALLKGVTSSLITGGLASLEGHADTITLKRSKAVIGTPSTLIEEALS